MSHTFLVVVLISVLVFVPTYSFSPTHYPKGQNKTRTTTTRTNFNTTTARTPLPSRNNRTRIVGGIETERNEYPFIVTLSKLGQHFCGGSIIDHSWVITAAHCVSRPDFNLTAGEHDIRIGEGTEQFVTAEKVIRHPKYNPVTYEDDIALVKVFPPFKFTEYVQSFNLPSVHFVASGSVLTAGWGVVDEGSHEVSPVLRKVTIELFSNIECAKMYGKEFHSAKMICAGTENGGKDACQGDSGGPLLCDDYHNGATLCGIVSFGFGCARSDFAGVYTKVAYYADWITWEQSRDLNPDSSNLWSTYEPASTPSSAQINITSTPSNQKRSTTQRPRRRPGKTTSDANKLTSTTFIIIFVTVSAALF